MYSRVSAKCTSQRRTAASSGAPPLLQPFMKCHKVVICSTDLKRTVSRSLSPLRLSNWNSDRTSSLAKSWQPNKQQCEYSSFSGRLTNSDESRDMKTALMQVLWNMTATVYGKIAHTDFDEFTVYLTQMREEANVSECCHPCDSPLQETVYSSDTLY